MKALACFFLNTLRPSSEKLLRFFTRLSDVWVCNQLAIFYRECCKLTAPYSERMFEYKSIFQQNIGYLNL